MSAVVVTAAAGNFAVAPAWAQTSIAGGTISGSGSVSGDASSGVLISGQNGNAGADIATGLTVNNTSGSTTTDALQEVSATGNTAAELGLSGVNSLSTSVNGGAAVELVVTGTGNASLGDSGGNSLTGSYGVKVNSPGNFWMVLTNGVSGDTITANGSAVAGISANANGLTSLTLGSTTISGFATGISTSTTSGPVTITSAAGSTISGVTSAGIYAISGAASGQGVSVTSASAITGTGAAVGVNAASNGGANTITTLAGGTINGGAYGISVSGAAGANATNITVGAAIGDSSAPSADGILASGSSTAANTINVNADVNGRLTGIQINGGNFITTVASGVTVASSSGSGIVDGGASGTLTVNNQGTISGFRAIDTGTSNLVVTNSGTLTGSAQAINGNAITLVNSGTITAGTANSNIVAVLATSLNLVNTGTITSVNAQGIYTNGVGQIVNGATGTITGVGGTKASINLAGGGSVDNYGSLAQGITAGGSTTLTLEAGSNTGNVALGSGGNTVNVYTGSGSSAAAVVDSGSGLTLRAAGASAAASFGGMALGSGANTLNLLGAGDGTAANGAAGSIDLSQVSGASTLAKSGTGTWTLTGDASSAGVTTINAGNGAPGGVLVFNGSGLSADVYVKGTQVVANSAAALGTGTIHAIDPLITFASTDTYANNISLETTSASDPTVLQTTSGVTATLSGAITTGTGAGVLANQALTIDGPGTIVLANSGNNWSGVTTINSGSTLQGTSATVSGGSIVDNGTLVYSQSAAGTVNQAISGGGSVLVGGGGNVTLAGAGTWTGTTGIGLGATFTGTTASIGGASILDAGTLAYVQSGSGTVVQNISGPGAVTVGGLGSGQTLTFAGALTQTGGFTITDGSNVTLAAGASYVGGGSINTNSGTFTNLGLVDSTQTQAILANVGGTIVNGATGSNSATIVGANYGVNAAAAGEVINNYGLIASGAYNAGTTTFGGTAGVYLGAGGTVTNNVGAVIGGGYAGVQIEGGSSSTITNDGAITGGDNGVYIQSGTAQIANTGSIAASNAGGNGIFVTGTANVVIANSGTIEAPTTGGGGAWGVAFFTPGVLVNTGTVSADEGVEVDGGVATVTNGAAGVITGTTYGVETADGSTPTGLTLVNYGQITGGGLSILGTGTNAVSLMAGSSTSGAITFGAGANTLSLYTGAVVGQPLVDVTTGLTVQGAGTYGAASFGAIAFDAGGTNAINLMGAGDGTAANGAAGTLNLASLTNATTLNKGDTGTWALTGDASGAGVTTINAGNGAPSGLLTFNTTGLTAAINVDGAKIQALSAGAFGTGVITAIDPTIEYSATGSYANPIVLASTSASDPTQLQADAGVTATLTGAITSGSGNGALAAQQVVFDGGGTIVLTNAGDSWTGATTINAGSTLALAGAGAIAGTAGVIDSGTFDISGSTVGGATVASLSGSGAVRLGANTLTLAAASGAFSGAIGGTGGLTVAGGTETLGGANTYTGATIVNVGATLALAGTGSIASSSGLTANGTFDVSNATGGVTLASLSGGGAVSLGANTLTLAAASGVFSGGIGGTGGLTVAGGTETLGGSNIIPGVNTYTGATTINAGATLALAGTGSVASSSGVIDNGTFDISRGLAGATVASLSGSGSVSLGVHNLVLAAASGAFSGAIGGTGGLAVAGGTETLGGANTYTGATAINAGATLALAGTGSIASSSGLADNGTFDVSNATAGVTLASLSGSGAVSLGANTLTLASASGAFSGAIGGTGGLTVAVGTETLGGGNTYTGATTIDAGATLALAGGGSIASSAGLANNGTFDASNATAGVTLASLSGSGVVDLGTNTLTDGASGTDTTFSGGISGAGGLTKVGAGELSLTGDNTYTGPTLVQAGILSVDGSIANSAVTVATGGTLSGAGTVGSLTVNGVVTPGGVAIGTLTVNGNLTLGSTSVYQAQINQAGQSDLIAVSGDAHLSGTLQISAAPGAYVRRTTYQLVTASNVTGGFSSVTGNLPFVDPTVLNTSNGAELLWQNNQVAFQSLAVTPNQRAAAAAIYQAPSSPLYAAISTQTAAGARQAFDAISGEVYADAPAELVQESHVVRDALLQRLRDGASPSAIQAGSYGGASDVTVWVQGVGDFARSAAEQGGGVASTQADTAGAMLGVDAKLPVANNWRVGVATAYTDTTLNDDGRGSHQTIDATHIAGYAGGAVIGDLQARLGFDYAWTRLDTHRQVTFPGVNETDKASPDAQVADLFVETGYVFRFGRLRVEPFANGAYVHATVDAAQETGGIATLNLGKDALDAELTEAGLRVSGSWRITPSSALEPYLSLSERHAFGDDGSSALLSFTGGGSAFLTRGVALDRDAGAVEFGGVFDLGDRVQVDAAYTSQISRHWQDEGLKLTASYRF